MTAGYDPHGCFVLLMVLLHAAGETRDPVWLGFCPIPSCQMFCYQMLRYLVLCHLTHGAALRAYCAQGPMQCAALRYRLAVVGPQCPAGRL